MIALSMAHAVLVGFLLVVAGMLAERAAALAGWARRGIWTVALVVAMALPIIGPFRTAVDDVASVTSIDASAGGPSASAVARWRVSAVDAWHRDLSARVPFLEPYKAFLIATWLSTSAAAALWYLGGVAVLARRRSGWRRAVVQGHAVVVSAATGPAVVGVWKPEIVLPEWAVSLEVRSLDIVLRHEAEHLRAGDHWLVHLTRLAVVVMPWNPAMWWMAARLRLAVEYDCDARVLAPRDGTAIDASAYAALLLTVAERPARATGAMSPALIESSTNLFRRIVAMCPADVRFPRLRALLALTAALALCVAACGAPTPARQTPVEPTVVQSPEVGGPPPTGEGPTPAEVISPQGPSVTPQGPVPSSERTTPRRGQAREQTAAPAGRPSVFRPGAGIVNPVPIEQPLPRYTPAPTPAVRPTVLRPGAGIVNPVPIEQPRPRYTPEAMRAKLQGRVELEVVVEADGTVGDVVVVRSLDAEFGLDASAIDAARRWRFQPATRDGQPVAVVVTLDLLFEIH